MNRLGVDLGERVRRAGHGGPVDEHRDGVARSVRPHTESRQVVHHLAVAPQRTPTGRQHRHLRAERNNPSIRSPHAEATCSQLSSTSSKCRSASDRCSATSGRPPAASRRPSAAASASSRSPGSVTATIGTQTTPSLNLHRGSMPDRRANSTDSLDFPAPPMPQIVTSRAEPTSSVSLDSSALRPTKRVRYVGSGSPSNA